MPKQPQADNPQDRVSCARCRTEIPRSEAFQPEAEDYTVFFCGLDCYEAWRREAEEQGFDETPFKRGPTD